MAIHQSSADPNYSPTPPSHFFVWREFVWGAIVGGFGKGMMHPIDTIKTRIQSQAILDSNQKPKTVLQMVRVVGSSDGLRGNVRSVCWTFVIVCRFYRGFAPGITGSFATEATYFGFIESTKKRIHESHPSLGGHWSHFIAGAIGMFGGRCTRKFHGWQALVQGTETSWNSIAMKGKLPTKPSSPMYGYYTGMFQAGRSILKEQGVRGLYAGDLPFAGLMIMFYEALKEVTEYGKEKWKYSSSFLNSSVEGLLVGGLAGGLSAYLTTPLDVIKTRLQVQGSTIRYNGWFDAVHRTWLIEGPKGLFRGSVPRISWYIPASALMFMAVEFLRDQFNDDDVQEIATASLSMESSDNKGSLEEVS